MTPAQTISLYQPLLHRIAYNLVRSNADAEDIVQETFLRWLTIDQQKIENTKAYLIRAVTNNCLSHLETIKKKKQEYLDTINASEFVQKLKEMNFSHLDLDVELKRAFKTLQTKLQPLERAVFLLKEVFDFDYDSLQKTLDKKKDHCRQLLARARKKLGEETSKVHNDISKATHLMEVFRKENISDLITHLKEDIKKKF
jgi:RNA polymerase sigma factor (sigma-70 family)